MKKLLLLCTFLILGFTVCSAQDNQTAPDAFTGTQDTLVCKNGKKIIGTVISVSKQKVVYMIPPDSTPRTISSWRMDYIAYPGGTKFNFTDISKPPMPSLTQFYLSADFGFSVPSISYRDGIAGTHFDIRPTYYVSRNVGLTARLSEDLNGTGFEYIANNAWGGLYIFQQYLAGATYRIGGKTGFPFVDFVALGGFCIATNPVYETGGGPNPLVVNTPGTGKGPGFYAGIDFTNSSDHLCSITFGAGVLGASFSYSNYSTTTATYDPATKITTNVVTDPATKMSLALFQMYIGLNFRLKKADR